MPPKPASSPQSFNTNLLEPDALTTPGELPTVLRSVERVCYHGDSSIMHMIEELNRRPQVFEYIMSTLDSQPFERLSKWTVARFPAPDAPNLMEALCIKLLQRLSSSLMPAEGVVTVEQRKDLRELRSRTGLSLNVLKELDGCAGRASAGVNVSQSSRKKPKGSARNLQLDAYPFDCMGIPVPATEHEVHTVRGDILLQLKGILGDYLRFLRRSGISDLFKRQLEKSGTTTTAPITEPIEASLYFDNVEGFGGWRILLSPKAQKYLRGNAVMYEIVVKKMKELSQGHFSRDNQKRLTGAKTIIPVYEAKMTGDTRLVYRIDCVPDGEGESQVISVFGIYTHAQMGHGRFWDTLSQQLENKGPHYIARCTFRNKPLNTGDNAILPASFAQLSVQEIQESVPLVNVCEEGSENRRTPLVKPCEEELANVHSIHALEKLVIRSQVILNSILENGDLAHMLSLSAQQQEILKVTSSCYITGRSGAGKTTTMLLKMLGIERAWEQFPYMWDKPRQIFVTRSRFLATKTKEDFSKLTLLVEATSYSPEELRKNTEKKMEYIDLDDKAHLPVKFSELTDDHFPLFITYEQLCLMLLNDIREENDNDGAIISGTPITLGSGGSPTNPLSSWRTQHGGFLTSVPAPDRCERDGGRFLSYLTFLSWYWNRFPQFIIRGLDPALVFGQILGVIKGSERAIGTEQQCLDRGAYSSCSRRGMSSHTKDAVYDIFTEYAKLKRERLEYDVADRTHYILKKLCGTESSVTLHSTYF